EVTNGGAGTAHGVTVTDGLPTSTGTSWTVDGGTAAATCTTTSGTLTCNVGDLGSGASATVHLTSPTTPATCGTVDNTASVATTNDGSAQSSASVTVNCPDVTILKTADHDTINAGDNAAFTITVSNSGPGSAYNVAV